MVSFSGVNKCERSVSSTHVVNLQMYAHVHKRHHDITRRERDIIVFRGCVRVVGVFTDTLSNSVAIYYSPVKMLPAAVNAVEIFVALLYFISHATIGGKH